MPSAHRLSAGRTRNSSLPTSASSGRGRAGPSPSRPAASSSVLSAAQLQQQLMRQFSGAGNGATGSRVNANSSSNNTSSRQRGAAGDGGRAPTTRTDPRDSGDSATQQRRPLGPLGEVTAGVNPPRPPRVVGAQAPTAPNVVQQRPSTLNGHDRTGDNTSSSSAVPTAPGGGMTAPSTLPEARDLPANDRRRNDQQQQQVMWSAVALQQHMARELLSQGRLPQSVPQPSAQAPGRLSLAQQMGLAPAPPAAPSEPEWADAERRAVDRGDVLRPCAICHEAFGVLNNRVATITDGGERKKADAEGERQVILSCSHVFHHRCLKQFERFARQQHHDRRCPICRRAHYHKRFHHAGAAMVQTHCITVVQARWRGILARRVFLKLRLAHDPKFKADYYYEKLQRYADAQVERADAREKEMDDFLEHIELQRQWAAASFMSEHDWAAVFTAVKQRIKGRTQPVENGDHQNAAPSTPSDTRDVASCGKEVEEEEDDTCPICLTAVDLPPDFGAPTQATTQRREPRSYTERMIDDIAGGGETSGRSRHFGVAVRDVDHTQQSPVSGRRAVSESTRVGATEQDDEATEEPAKGACKPFVATSCKHCFHQQCLQTFETFAAASRNAPCLAPGSEGQEPVPISRCPVCRSAYAKRTFT